MGYPLFTRSHETIYFDADGVYYGVDADLTGLIFRW